MSMFQPSADHIIEIKTSSKQEQRFTHSSWSCTIHDGIVNNGRGWWPYRHIRVVVFLYCICNSTRSKASVWSRSNEGRRTSFLWRVDAMLCLSALKSFVNISEKVAYALSTSWISRIARYDTQQLTHHIQVSQSPLVLVKRMSVAWPTRMSRCGANQGLWIPWHKFHLPMPKVFKLYVSQALAFFFAP